MILTTILAALLMAASPAVNAASPALPAAPSFPAPDLPEIPAYTVSILDFGAVPDGITLNTEAFAKAFSALDKAGGGRLTVPAGIWLTGPISMKDRTDLHLEKGAILLFSPDKSLFLDANGKVVPAIKASKRSDVCITGEGIIDGNGEWWRAVKRGKVSDVEWRDFKRMGGTEAEDGTLWYPFALNHTPDIAPDYREQERLRTHLIRFTDCTRVLVEGVTVQNSPKFHIVPQRCKHVTLKDVSVRCPWNAQNGDGIDIMQCSDVLVTGCTVDVGDDGICLKGGAGAASLKDGPVERVTICGNTVFHAHGGFVIGSEFSAGIRDIVVIDNTFCGTDTGLRFKSAPGRGGLTERIRISDIRMTDIRDEAIVFETSYVDVPVGEKGRQSQVQEFMPEFADIVISDVVCRDARIGIRAQGTPETIHDITLKDCTIFWTEKGAELSREGLLDLSGVRLVSW